MDVYEQTGLDLLESEFPSLHEILVLHGLTSMDLLIMNNAGQIARKVGRSALEVGEYLEKLKTLLQCPQNKIEKNQTMYIPTGLQALDLQLGGGIPRGEVTEVVGASGSGKSQFLLRLALSIHPSVLITTEAPLETRRMHDMILGSESKKTILDNISCIYCPDLEFQDHILHTQLPLKLDEGRYKCVIIDSISHHLRRDDTITPTDYLMKQLLSQQEKLNCEGLKHFEREHELMRNQFFKSDTKYTERQSRQQYVHGLYSYLLKLARQYDVAVVVANQVSDYSTPFTDKVTDCILDLDCQIGLYSGWDNSTSYRSCHPESQIDVNFDRSSDLRDVLLGSLAENNDGPPLKMQKVGETQSSSQKRATQHLGVSEQIDLLDELHSYTGMETKRQVPTLGYAWSRFVKNRILLMKTYKPTYKTAESFLPADESTQVAPSSRHISSIIGGWKMERYYRVICSAFDTCNANNYPKIPFLLDTSGISEITTL